MEKIIYKCIIKEVNVSKKSKNSISQYKQNGWSITYDGKTGVTMRKIETEGTLPEAYKEK